MATLYIDKSDSTCGACGKGADPYEESHITLVGWHAINGQTKGCGAVYDAVSSHYSFLGGLEERIEEMRPDLPWLGGSIDPYKAPELFSGR
jgi:hypothetical protein